MTRSIHSGVAIERGPQSPSANAAAVANSAVRQSTSPPDRIVLQNGELPILLTVTAASAAQLVPGVVEAEGVGSAAAALAAGIRCAAAHPAAKAALAAAAGAAGSYAKSLFHDAAVGQPAFKHMSDFAQSVDGSIHSALGIPSSDGR